MCAAGGDVQHLTGSEELFNHGIFLARCFFNSLTAFKILNISDYLYTFTIKRFRMTSFCLNEAACRHDPQEVKYKNGELQQYDFCFLFHPFF